MTWKVSLFLNVGDINIFFIEQHISITATYKNRPILFDEKLKTDFCTEDNTEQFKLHLQRYINKWTPWRIITLLWSRGLVYLNDPESYASGAWVLAGSPMLDRSKGKRQTKSDPPAPQVGGWVTWDQASIFFFCFFGSRGKKNNAWYIYLTSSQPPPNLHNLTFAWPVMFLANKRLPNGNQILARIMSLLKSVLGKKNLRLGVGRWTEKVFRYGNSNGGYQNNWINWLPELSEDTVLKAVR